MEMASKVALAAERCHTLPVTHCCRTSPLIISPKIHPSYENVEFCKDQGDHGRASLMNPQKFRFLSLSIYDNYTTGRKCNRADWEIWECDSSKPHVPGITFNRTCTASRSRGFCLTAGGTNLNKTELLCPISDKSGQKLRASPGTHRSCRGWPCSPALTCSSRRFQPSSAASWGQGRTRSRCHGEPGSGAPARSHSAR